MSTPNAIYQLRIRLTDLQPPIWRRVEVEDCILLKLHKIVEPTAEQAKVAEMFPALSKFVQDCGYIEIGDLDGCGFIVTAEDYDGVRVFEDDNLSTLVEALAALEKELTMWFNEKENKLRSVTKKSARFRRNS